MRAIVAIPAALVGVLLTTPSDAEPQTVEETPCHAQEITFSDQRAGFDDRGTLLEVGCPSPGYWWSVADCVTGGILDVDLTAPQLELATLDGFTELRNEVFVRPDDLSLEALSDRLETVGAVVSARQPASAPPASWCRQS